MRFKLIVSNIENVTMAHIHVANAPGANGPPAVWLYPAVPPAQLIPGRFDGVLAQGRFTAADLVSLLAEMTLDDLRTAIQEGRACVNVHTASIRPARSGAKFTDLATRAADGQRVTATTSTQLSRRRPVPVANEDGPSQSQCLRLVVALAAREPEAYGTRGICIACACLRRAMTLAMREPEACNTRHAPAD